MVKILKLLHRHKKKSIATLILILVVSGAYFTYHWLNKPAYGTVTLTAEQTTGSKKPVFSNLKGAYISASYPERYEQVSNQNQTSSLEYWILVARQRIGIGNAGQINLSVSKLQAGGVKEESAYKHFKAFPDKYTVTTTDLFGEPATVAVRSDPTYERTILWAHGKYLLSVSLTAGAENDQLIEDMDKILASILWLQ